MSDYLIASDLSLKVLERRRLKAELGPCQLDSTNLRLYGLPSQHAAREAFIADPDAIADDSLTPKRLRER